MRNLFGYKTARTHKSVSSEAIFQRFPHVHIYTFKIITKIMKPHFSQQITYIRQCSTLTIEHIQLTFCCVAFSSKIKYSKYFPINGRSVAAADIINELDYKIVSCTQYIFFSYKYFKWPPLHCTSRATRTQCQLHIQFHF